VAAVKSTLLELPGVARVDIEFANRIAKCQVSADEFDADEAIGKLAEAGFENSSLAD